jgi:mannosyltransferase
MQVVTRVEEREREAIERGRTAVNRSRRGPWSWPAAAGAVLVAAGIALRLWAPSALWLDEAQAVAIARLPVADLFAALRQDGAPPLYYLLLHGWIAAFGSSGVAVRSLSVCLSLVALALVWKVGEVVGGRRTAGVAVVLLATSPFAIRYATEARMYALVLALVLAGLALVMARTRPRPPLRLAGVSAVVAALLLTHYWTFFFLGAAVPALAWRAWRRPASRYDDTWLMAAMTAGVVPFLPWILSFLVQLGHTGAPWGRPPGFSMVEWAIRGFAGGSGDAARSLELLLIAFVGSVVIARTRRTGTLALLGLGTLLVGAAVTLVTGDGFAPRHATVAFPPVLVAAAAGMAGLEPARTRRAVVALAAVLGLLAAWPAVWAPRTQVAEVATVLRENAAPGDAVVTCPDQLAPALSRLVPSAGVSAYPPGTLDAGRIDWTDYRDRVTGTDPIAFAQTLDAANAGRAIWLVWSPNYEGVGSRCRKVQQALAALRPAGRQAVRLRRAVFENAALWYAPPR